jgi:putative phosphotransacetylase
MQVKVEVSARHIHLTRQDIDILFGKDYKLKSLRKLSQSDDFAAEEKVSLKTEKSNLSLRVVGKERKYSQVEISMTDAINLGIDAPLRISGELENVPKFRIKGPAGEAEVPVIIAKRHLHISSEKAIELDLRGGDKVSVKIEGERKLIFKNVIVRVAENYMLACHIDTDEGNSCGFGKICGEGELLYSKS